MSGVALPPQLREELEMARQTHSAEVEGVRREVSKLTGELHQRDVSISALSGSSASIQQQLRGEAQRAAEAATQLKVSLGPCGSETCVKRKEKNLEELFFFFSVTNI